MRFALAEQEVLLDGEILEDGLWLVRRPVAFFRLDTPRELFTGAEGRRLEKTTMDRTMLPILGPSEVYVFHTDIESREQRRASPAASSEEKQMIVDWMDKYRLPLSAPGVKHPVARELCPATWKTLKAAFDAKVL